MSLLGARFSLSVVIAEGNHNSDTVTGKSHTADISRKARSNKFNFFLFERVSTHNCRNKKSVRIESVLAVKDLNQVESLISCRY
jgi:hypothetical protein